MSEHLRSSSNLFTLMLIVQNLGSAMADVVIDAMIAEAVRSAGPKFAGDLQSSMAVGGIFGSLLGGYALSNLPINAIDIIFSALPLFQLVTCVFIKESPKGFESTTDNAAHDHADGQNIDSAFAGQGSGESFKYEGTRKRKGARKKSKRRSLSKRSEAHEKHNKSVNLYSSLKSALVSLCTAFKQPAILRSKYLNSHVLLSNGGSTSGEASFLGTARVIGWFNLMLGTYIYNRYLKHKKLRNILMFAHVGLAIITVLDILLVSRLHIQYGIADKYMVLWGSALADAINQFKMMPFLILSGQLCPPGIEGTLFALFMSINNLNSTLGSFLGAALASALNISSVQFDNLALGLAVRLL
ncbi:probable folate-biopterin transporter 4 isoform X2 [Triticum urartu]|uniref:probable folate-biopterin transporter 4 isoform X2 n=1 Tax=Triticum urartu TaxID=4572 RepID=UPI002043FCC8|nr:probable folate-biopterin transporter 4 isoform X2 [Triticum urartu]